MKKSYIQPKVFIEKIDICHDLLTNSPKPDPDPSATGNHESFDREEENLNW